MNAGAAASPASRITITRPDNILVQGGQIAQVIDWDCAFVDHQMHDVAYAAFQFGQRLRDTDLHSVDLFVNAYLAERGIADLPGPIISWFLRFAVVKRLLINGSNTERIRLLRDFDRQDRPPHLVTTTARGRGRPQPGGMDATPLNTAPVTQSMAIGAKAVQRA